MIETLINSFTYLIYDSSSEEKKLPFEFKTMTLSPLSTIPRKLNARAYIDFVINADFGCILRSLYIFDNLHVTI